MIEIFQSLGAGMTGALGAPMLPLLPAILAWAWASSHAGNRWAPLGFVASFAAGFAALNAGDGWLIAHADLGALIAGLAIAAYGLDAMGALRVPGVKYWAPLLGVAFAFGWAPLPSAALAKAAEFGPFALAAYGAGLAFFAWPSILILIRISRDKSYRPRRVDSVAGLTLFATGATVAAGLFAELGFALDENFPALRSLG